MESAAAEALECSSTQRQIKRVEGQLYRTPVVPRRLGSKNHPYPVWCSVIVRGRSLADQHRRQEDAMLNTLSLRSNVCAPGMAVGFDIPG